MNRMDIDHIAWDDWIRLPEEEKERILASLNPYAGEGLLLIQRLRDKFIQEYGDQEGILSVEDGVYHGGYYVITVLVQLPKIPKTPQLPESYQGLQVLKFYTYATSALREKLGDDYNELGEYIDRYYSEIQEKLEKKGLTFESASKEEIVLVVEEFKHQ